MDLRPDSKFHLCKWRRASQEEACVFALSLPLLARVRLAVGGAPRLLAQREGTRRGGEGETTPLRADEVASARSLRRTDSGRAWVFVRMRRFALSEGKRGGPRATTTTELTAAAAAAAAAPRAAAPPCGPALPACSCCWFGAGAARVVSSVRTFFRPAVWGDARGTLLESCRQAGRGSCGHLHSKTRGLGAIEAKRARSRRPGRSRIDAHTFCATSMKAAARSQQVAYLPGAA
eukprot:scaffold1862_cov576-Prasinococcus_capsulatus_cf.AAC.10